MYIRDDETVFGPILYTNANQRDDVETRESTWWRDKRTVALFSAEAEYIALILAAQELLWSDTSFKKYLSPTAMHVDNQAAIAMALSISRDIY
ncbi:hypothetical protein Plhal710r2_c024g0097481 [Plasmopara halstedii]